MDFSLIVERTFNTGEILEVLLNETILDSISEDDFNIDDLQPNVFTEYWLSFEEDGEVLGCIQLKPIFKKCWDAHIHVLPIHRDKSREIGAGIISWCKENIEGLLYTTVPIYCENVICFLKDFEFKQTGIIPQAWNKNDKQHDLVILTRII